MHELYKIISRWFSIQRLVILVGRADGTPRRSLGDHYMVSLPFSTSVKKKHFTKQEKMRIFAVDKSTEYHEVINRETAIFASMVVQPPLK